MDQRPIGVFDSGSGGLTAVREIRSILPSENIIYFGDTSRVPYGGRSAEILLRYARQDVHFLRSFDVKALLVACGLCASNGEARRLIQQGGVAVNDQKVASIDVTFDQAQFAGDGVVIKKGKKVFHRAYTA